MVAFEYLLFASGRKCTACDEMLFTCAPTKLHLQIIAWLAGDFAFIRKRQLPSIACDFTSLRQWQSTKITRGFTSLHLRFYVPSPVPSSLFASAGQKLPFSPTICRVFWHQRFYTRRISVVSLPPIFLGKQSFAGKYIASFYSTNILQTCCKFPKILLIFKHQLCKIILNSTQSCCNIPVFCHARWLILIQCLDEQQWCK